MGLGSTEDVTLAEARDKAREARRVLLDGKDPIQARKEERVHFTFREVAAQYIAAHEDTWKSAVHRRQWDTTLDSYVFPHFGDHPISAVTTADVMHAIEPIWASANETASRTRGRIESIIDYASARGWRSGENPARWRGHLANLLPARSRVMKVAHHPALPWAEAAPFMTLLAAQTGTGAVAMRFAILTAARTSEVLGATWDEIDIEAASWTVPAERMKAGVEWRQPLSREAMAVLAVMKPLGERYLVPGRKSDTSMSNMALLATLRRMNRDDLTVHGFRSTFRDWAAEATDHPRELAEAALAHTLRDKVEAAYRRGDLFEKRRMLLQDWADHCGSVAEKITTSL